MEVVDLDGGRVRRIGQGRAGRGREERRGRAQNAQQ